MCEAETFHLTDAFWKEKAIQFEGRLGHTNFTASSGWLQRFEDRHGIIFRNINSESGSVNETILKEWLDSKKELIKQFNPTDSNAEETGLFYQLLSEKTFALKGELQRKQTIKNPSGGFALLQYMDGSEKNKVLVVGKSQKPSLSKNCNRLPVIYRANKKYFG